MMTNQRLGVKLDEIKNRTASYMFFISSILNLSFSMKRFYTGYLILAAWIGTTVVALAQQKIGNNLGTLHPGAVLELESTNRGFLPSRVALIASNVWSLNGTAVNGMMVYNTATVTGANALTPGYYMWQDGSWVRIVTGVISTTNALTYTPGTQTLTSNVNGVSSDAVLPLASGSVTGLLSSTDFNTFNGKENVLTFANGLTRSANEITLGGVLNQNTTLTLAANNFTFGGATTGKVIVSGPAGSATSGLQLSNLLTAVTPNAAVASQRVLTVDANGNVILGTDFGTNNAGTVTNVSGTAPINVATGTTTPVISINALGITTDLIADDAITTPKIVDGAVTPEKLAPGTDGQYLTTVGGITTWAALPTPAVTGATNGTSLVAGNVELGGALTKPTTITTSSSNILTIDADGAGQLIVNGPSGNTSGLQLANFTGTGNVAVAGQKVLTVDGSGNVVLGTDYATAGTVTAVTGIAPILVSNGATTPEISIQVGGITTPLLADGSVTTSKLAPAGTAGQVLTSTGPTTPPVWEDPAVSGADNGLSVLNGNVELGGTLYKNTNLAGNFNLTLSGTGSLGVGTGTPTSTLDVRGSIALAIRKVSAATSIANTDHTLLANAFAAGYAITLPSPNTCEGRILTIRKTDESSNAITFTFTGISGSNAIRVSDSSASAGVYINSLNYTRTLRIQSDGTDWYLID